MSYYRFDCSALWQTRLWANERRDRRFLRFINHKKAKWNKRNLSRGQQWFLPCLLGFWISCYYSLEAKKAAAHGAPAGARHPQRVLSVRGGCQTKFSVLSQKSSAAKVTKKMEEVSVCNTTRPWWFGLCLMNRDGWKVTKKKKTRTHKHYRKKQYYPFQEYDTIDNISGVCFTAHLFRSQGRFISS